jgi:hypothetical protein
MLAHDEVRERAPVLFQPAYELHRDARVLTVLDANHLRMQMQRVLPRKVEVDLERVAFVHRLGRTHEQAVSRHILDQPVDDDTLNATASAETDRDSNSFPLVHVVKATLSTYV